MFQINYASKEDYLNYLDRHQDQVHQNSIRLEGYRVTTNTQAAHIKFVRFFILLTARIDDEIHFTNILMGETDDWGKAFPQSGERMKFLQEKSKQVQALLSDLIPASLSLEKGAYSVTLDKVPSAIWPDEDVPDLEAPPDRP